jgi:hypothetical protein
MGLTFTVEDGTGIAMEGIVLTPLRGCAIGVKEP